MIVCITGFNRSGTSMVARMLQAVGLSLGPEEGLDASVAENEVLREVSTKAMKALENFPYRLHWPGPQALESRKILGRGAAEYFEGFSESEPWGWKDPQAGVLAELWADGFNKRDFRVVLCMRNPADCAKSLEATGNAGGFDAHMLNWMLYQRKALHAMGRVPFVVTHYEDYFVDPRAEFMRVLDFLGWGHTKMGDALAVVDRSKRHFGKD